MKVGIYIPNWIGDCVMALPFLAECKKKHQNDKIICIARQWVSPVLEKNSNIDELIIITKDQDTDQMVIKITKEMVKTLLL